MRRVFGLVAALCFLAYALSLYAGEVSPRRGGTLAMAIGRDMTLMNPLVATRSTEQSIRELMFEPLLGIDLKGNIRPSLAEKWEVGQDGKVYTFYLRRGVRFHNGQEMTGEDVKFAADYTMNPKNGAYGFTHLTQVERVDALDKYRIRIQTKTASPGFLFSLTSIQALSVIPAGSLREGVDKPSRFPPGTGPFRFVEWKPRQAIVLERFGEYWGQKAYLDRVILRPISDDTVRFTALRAGDVDMIERTPYEWATQVLEGKLKGLGIVRAPHAGYRRIVFNAAQPPFDNKKLRQAVAFAVDKREILQAAYFGLAEEVDQRYPKGHMWHIEGIGAPGHNPDKARALLREAGYDGRVIEIMVRQGQDQETEAAVLQAQLSRIGLKAKQDLVDSSAYLTRSRTGEFALKFSGGNFDPDPSPTYDLVCPPDLKKRTSNASAYCDPEMDLLIARAEKEMDPQKRRELVRQIVRKVSEDAPEVPIGFVPRVFTFRESVKDFTTNAEGAFRWLGGGLNYVWLER